MTRNKEYFFGNFYVGLSPFKTLWFSRDKTKKGLALREDKLIALTRIYVRMTRTYVYSLYLGPLHLAYYKYERIL